MGYLLFVIWEEEEVEALNLKHEIRKEETEPRMNANAREWERLWIVDCGLEKKKERLLHRSWIIMIQAVLGASRSKF